MKEDKGRRAEVELMFKKYPEVPREPIIQTDVAINGVDCTESALRFVEPYHSKSYNLFIWDRDAPDAKWSKVPDQIHITGGIYDLRGNTTLDWHVHRNSEYIVDLIDGKLTLCTKENGQHIPIASILDPYPRPKYKDKHFEDGTSYGEVVDVIPGKPFTRFVALRMCQFWGYDEECKFCDINRAAKEQQRVGLRSKRGWFEKPEQVKEAFREAYFGEEWPPGRLPAGILFTGGTILGKVDGLNEDDFYMRYADAIHEAIGYRWPLCLQTGPKTREVAKRYRLNGIDAHETNLEVWDERLFNIICPGKVKHMGREQWIKLMLDEVDVFGEGNVTPCFVEGVEMCQPWGFKTVDEAVKSTAEGWDFLMSHGVVPRPNLWVVSPKSALKGNTPAPLEFFVKMDFTWHELWHKYTLPPVRRFNLMGPGREQAERGWLSMGY